MPRFKIVSSSILGVFVLGSLSSPVFAKRRRPPPPPTEAEPTTEAPPESPAHSVATITPAEPPSEAPRERKVASAPAPTVERDAALPAPAVAHAPSDMEATREGPRADAGSPASRLIGHVGVGAPLATLRASRSTQHVGSVNEDFTLVAPIGLGMALTESWAFDLEFQISTGVRPEGLTTAIVDPGVIYMGQRLGAGLRVAWQLNANQNIGLIPLVRVAVLRNARATWFVEASLPSFVRNKQLTASASLQTGIGF